MPQVRLRGVQIFRMIPLVGTHLLGGMLRIRGSWGREITLLMLAFGNVLERVQRTTLAIREGWQDEDAGSATCRAREIPQGTEGLSTYVWWWAKTALNEITFQGAGGLTAGKLYIVAWCE